MPLFRTVSGAISSELALPFTFTFNIGDNDASNMESSKNVTLFDMADMEWGVTRLFYTN